MADAIVPIVDYAVRIKPSDIPARVTNITKAFLLDTVGLMVAGVKAPGCDQVLDQLVEWGGRGEATLLGRQAKLPAPYAALGNALTAHAFDFDDTHERGDMHAYAVVFPAALAVAERVGGVSGKELLAAVTVGVDVAYRIGLGIKRYRGWHPTSMCGVFGAAIAAARVARLDRDTSHNVMGIAYSLSSGNFQCILDGSLTKRMQPAFASRAGAEAVIFAKRGITGAKNVLEGKFGLYPLYEAGEYNSLPLRDRLGTWFEGEAASLKPYPSCRFCHGAVDAILDMVANDGVKAADVESAVVKMPAEAYDYVGGPYKPGDSPQVSAQFNTAYNVAVALLRGRVGLSEFDARSVLDPEVRNLADRVETVATEEPYCFGPQEVTVHLRNGRTLTRNVAVMKGHPDKPMSRAEQHAKVAECFAVGGVPHASVEGLVDWIDDLESDPSPARSLVELLSRRQLVTS
jgi:2-methylcitrate dehydratase PrpD